MPTALTNKLINQQQLLAEIFPFLLLYTSFCLAATVSLSRITEDRARERERDERTFRCSHRKVPSKRWKCRNGWQWWWWNHKAQ